MPSPVLVAAQDAFERSFGGRATTFAQAPGRVELLGNHTDHNGGLVMAAAVDRHTVVVGRCAERRVARVVSVNFGQSDEFSIDALEAGAPGDWKRYVRGVVWGSQSLGLLASGFEAAIAGNVPLGAGLSSSASLQATVMMFLIAAGLVDRFALDDFADEPGRNNRMMLAALLRKVENEFVGVSCGLLDQFSALFGRAGHGLFLDCRSLAYEQLPLGDPAPAIVVCDSKTSRRLADGMYNERRAECERVVAHFQAKRGERHVSQLRDVSLDDLRSEWNTLDPVGRLRARHVLSENVRVLRGVQALREGDLAEFGAMMSASHASSRDDFGNSSPALDALIEAAEQAPGFLGGKLSGAGWAGCTVNLVVAQDAEAFADSVRSGYARRTRIEPEIHICCAAEGATGGSLAQDAAQEAT